MNLNEAYKYCEQISKTHYENFPVASIFINKKFRKYIYAVYAFARIADDISDNASLTQSEKLMQIEEYEEKLINHKDDAVFIALEDTMKKFSISQEEFRKLLKAFKQDAVKQRYYDINELMEYSENSANPIGRILLKIYGINDYDNIVKYSDRICTSLQLINFWQDVSRDLEIDRIYLPNVIMTKYNYSYEMLTQRIENESYKMVMKELVSLTKSLMDDGKPLLKYLKGGLKYELNLIINGGEKILEKIIKNDYKTLSKRPVINATDKLSILINCLKKA